MKDYLLGNYVGNPLIMRHDVDSKIESALKLAQIEKMHNLKATYYFRTDGIVRPDILKSINSLGHEVGYHYEVMDTAKGNSVEAVKLFDANLKAFRKICSIDTVCMHGNPRSSYNNLDLWNYCNLSDFNLLGEGYTSVDFTKILYFCDTSRTWNSSQFKVKDLVPENGMVCKGIKNTDDLICLIENHKYDQLYISTHPARWKENNLDSLKDIFLQRIKNAGKFILHYSFKFNCRKGYL